MNVNYQYKPEYQLYEFAFIDGDLSSFIRLKPDLNQQDTIEYLVNWFNHCLRLHEETPT